MAAATSTPTPAPPPTADDQHQAGSRGPWTVNAAASREFWWGGEGGEDTAAGVNGDGLCAAGGDGQAGVCVCVREADGKPPPAAVITPLTHLSTPSYLAAGATFTASGFCRQTGPSRAPAAPRRGVSSPAPPPWRQASRQRPSLAPREWRVSAQVPLPPTRWVTRNTERGDAMARWRGVYILLRSSPIGRGGGGGQGIQGRDKEESDRCSSAHGAVKTPAHPWRRGWTERCVEVPSPGEGTRAL